MHGTSEFKHGKEKPLYHPSSSGELYTKIADTDIIKSWLLSVKRAIKNTVVAAKAKMSLITTNL